MVVNNDVPTISSIAKIFVVNIPNTQFNIHVKDIRLKYNLHYSYM